MTVETMPIRRDWDSDDSEPERRDTVLVIGAGANTEHMIATGALTRLGEKHPLHYTDIRQPNFDVDPDKLHLVNTPEGQASLQRLIASEALHAVYVSVVPPLHVPVMEEYLGYVGEQKAKFVVVAKPVVQTVREMKAVDKLKAQAEQRLQEAGIEVNPDINPVLYVHEHYAEKGAWHTLRERLGDVAEHLGRLRSATIDIQEARTAESEGRVAAYAGGALEDLGPHTITLGLDIQDAINGTQRYTIPDRSETTVERFRYNRSELPKGVETSFIVRGKTTLIDNEQQTTSDLDFIWQGGKGLVDKKEAVLVFEHPTTGERTTVTVNLKDNTLDVPESIQHLFPETTFEDNGYGYVVEVGLNGGDPNKSFQSWEQARVVTKLQHHLARQGKTDLREYTRPEDGVSLQELGN